MSNEAETAASGAPLRGMIAAVTRDGVIGLHGKVPWHYPADLRRFRELTWGTTVIMGRKTWESLAVPLRGRRNLVITRGGVIGAEVFRSLDQAVAAAGEAPVWFVGGARIYEAAMSIATIIDLTIVPDLVTDPAAIRFPGIDPARWSCGPDEEFPGEPRLRLRRCLPLDRHPAAGR